MILFDVFKSTQHSYNSFFIQQLEFVGGGV
jgi:hypothetical protein